MTPNAAANCDLRHSYFRFVSCFAFSFSDFLLARHPSVTSGAPVADLRRQSAHAARLCRGDRLSRRHAGAGRRDWAAAQDRLRLLSRRPQAPLVGDRHVAGRDRHRRDRHHRRRRGGVHAWSRRRQLRVDRLRPGDDRRGVRLHPVLLSHRRLHRPGVSRTSLQRRRPLGDGTLLAAVYGVQSGHHAARIGQDDVGRLRLGRRPVHLGDGRTRRLVHLRRRTGRRRLHRHDSVCRDDRRLPAGARHGTDRSRRRRRVAGPTGRSRQPVRPRVDEASATAGGRARRTHLAHPAGRHGHSLSRGPASTSDWL